MVARLRGIAPPGHWISTVRIQPSQSSLSKVKPPVFGAGRGCAVKTTLKNNGWNMEVTMKQTNHWFSALFPAASILSRARELTHFPEAQMNGEISLDEIMADPIIRQVIAADHLNESDVRRTIARARKGQVHH